MNGTTDISRRKWSRFGWMMAAVLTLFGLLGLVAGLREVYRGWQSEGWPTAQGVVQSSTVQCHKDIDNNRGGSFGAEILYRFTVDDRAHTGTRVAFGGTSESSDRTPAQAVADRYPKGASVTVHYRPDDPDVCVLEAGLAAKTWVWPITGTIFLGAGFALVVVLARR
jgi:hypothetical protein